MIKKRRINNLKSIHNHQTSFLNRFLFNPKFFTIIILIFLLIILLPLIKNYNRRLLVEKEIADIQKKIDEFELKNKEFKEMIDYLQSDQSIEEQARLNMGLKFPGETVFVIKDDEIINNNSQPILIDNSPNWKKWWRYFTD